MLAPTPRGWRRWNVLEPPPRPAPYRRTWNTSKHDYHGPHAHQRHLRHSRPLASVLGSRRQAGARRRDSDAPGRLAAVPPVGRGHRRCGNGAAGLRRAGRLQRGCCPPSAPRAGRAGPAPRWHWACWSAPSATSAMGFFKRKGGNPSRAWTRASIRRCACCWPPARWPRPGHWPDDAARPGDARSIRYIFCDITIDWHLQYPAPLPPPFP